MLPRERPDRIEIAFDDHRLVSNAGLLLPVTLADNLGLDELVNRHVDLGNAPGRANAGDKLTTPTRCVLAGRLTLLAGWSRRRPRWRPSCGVSGGAMHASWIG